MKFFSIYKSQDTSRSIWNDLEWYHNNMKCRGMTLIHNFWRSYREKSIGLVWESIVTILAF